MTPDIITTPLLAPLRHGFFTRRGGASSGVFKGLNCGFGSGDRRDIVQGNRNRVAAAMDVAPDHLITLHQAHTAAVVTVTGPVPGMLPRADALVTKRPGVALAVLSADCQPVLFADPEAGVAGAAHAGWKGALGGVLEATITAMEALGADRTRIAAVIGPAISQRAYEVGPEFPDRFLQDDPDNTRFFASGRGDHYLFDLPGYGMARLRVAGIKAAAWTGHCTYGDAGRFFSYRRSIHRREADYGRLISAIRI